MWDIENSSPFSTERAVVIDKTGERHWVVMVKGTFDLAPDGTTPASAEQVPVFIAPVYRGAEGESSLLYEQDLSAAKPHTDIYLNATAHAPHGYPTREMTVGLGTPAGTKTLLVKGDRRWERNRYGEIGA